MINIQDIKQNSYSFNDETFYDFEPKSFPSEYNLYVDMVFYAGMKQELKTSDFFDVDTLIEQLQESAYCEHGDIAEGFLSCFSNDKRNESKLTVKGIEKLIHKVSLRMGIKSYYTQALSQPSSVMIMILWLLKGKIVIS